MEFDSYLYYKGNRAPNSVYASINKMQLEEIKNVGLTNHENMDFHEFLMDKLGDEYKELRREFEIEYFGEAKTYDKDLNLIE